MWPPAAAALALSGFLDTETRGDPGPQHSGEQLGQQGPELNLKHTQAPLEMSKKARGQGKRFSPRRGCEQLSWPKLAAVKVISVPPPLHTPKLSCWDKHILKAENSGY